MNIAYGIGGLIKTAPAPVTGRGIPPASFKAELGTQYFDISVSPPVEYVYNGSTWTTAGANPASTTTYGTVLLTDNSEPVATKVYADALAIAGAPVATETVPGIGELATDVEAVAGTPSTGLLALFVTPSNLAPVFAAPPNIGGTTPGTAAFTDLTITGDVSISSANPITIEVTGAGDDLTLASTAGSVVINGEEAVDTAIQLTSAAGGLAANVALSAVIATTEANADSLQLTSAGGMDITATGAAGKDIDLVCTSGSINITAGENAANSIVITSSIGGIDITAASASAGEDIDITATGSSVNITSTENNAGAIIVRANGGASERVTLLASQGTGADSINLESTAGGITLSAALATADAINLAASAGGVDIDGALQVNIASSQNAVDAIRIVSSAGGIDIDAVGAATEDINITNTGGSVVIVATESVVDAIRMNASGAAGGFDIDAGTNGFIVDTTGAISLDAAAASNFTATGAFDVTVSSTAGSINISGGEAAADALNFDAAAGGLDVDVALQMNLDSSQAAADAVRIRASNAAGGIDVDGGTAGITVDTTGALSLDSAGTTNLTATGAFTMTVNTTAGQLALAGGIAAANAVRINTTDVAGGIDADAGTGGITIDTTGVLSLDSAGATNLTATGAFDVTVNSTAGSLILRAGESAVDAVVLESTAGGVQILASGAAAGEDILMTATGSSVTITATENVTDAMNITASGAASRVNITAGTGSIKFASGWVVPITTKANADTPYTVLGTDYVINCDTSGGVLTVTLPAATALAGRTFVIRDGVGSAGVNNITIGGGGTNLVGGGAAAATKVISAAYAGATVYSNGTVWLYCYVA